MTDEVVARNIKSKYEYKVFDGNTMGLGGYVLVDILNAYGAQGWLLTAKVGECYIFARLNELRQDCEFGED